jgi:hypothetical protein
MSIKSIENLQLVRNYYAYRDNPASYHHLSSADNFWQKARDRFQNIKNALYNFLPFFFAA